jgi:hypothetical protein
MIHRATHGQMHAALERIDGLDCVRKPAKLIRVEHFT